MRRPLPARTVRRMLAILLTVAVLAGIGGAAWAQWASHVTFSAGVSSGTWGPSPTPTPTPTGSPSSTPIPTPTPTSPPPTAAIIAPGASTVMTGVVWTHSDGTALVPTTQASNRGRQMCANVTVRGASSTAATWSLLIDISGAPFNTEVPNFVYSGDWTLGRADDTHMVVTGTSKLASSQTLTVSLCNYFLQKTLVPASTSGPWTAATSAPYWSQDRSRACTDLTVTGTITDMQSYPFFFGWDTQIDLRPAAQLYQGGKGAAPNTATFAPQPNQGDNYVINDSTGQSWWQTYQDTFRLSSGITTALQGNGSTTITACVFKN